VTVLLRIRASEIADLQRFFRRRPGANCLHAMLYFPGNASVWIGDSAWLAKDF
jgi:hypothetical protein